MKRFPLFNKKTAPHLFTPIAVPKRFPLFDEKIAPILFEQIAVPAVSAHWVDEMLREHAAACESEAFRELSKHELTKEELSILLTDWVASIRKLGEDYKQLKATEEEL